MEVRDKREEGRSLNPPFHIPFYLFITNLIGLKYPTFLFYVWTEAEGHIPFSVLYTIPVFGAQIPLRNLTAYGR